MRGRYVHHDEAFLREDLKINTQDGENLMGIGEFYYRWECGEFESVTDDKDDILKLRGRMPDGVEYVTQKKLCHMTEEEHGVYVEREALSVERALQPDTSSKEELQVLYEAAKASGKLCV